MHLFACEVRTVTSKKVSAGIQWAIGRHKDLLILYRPMLLSSGLAKKSSWKAELKGEECKADKGTGDKITTGLQFSKFQRVVENR